MIVIGGTKMELSPVSLTVDQEKITLYADVSDDYNPIHVDPGFAATTSMGGVIAHGTMSLNLIWQSILATFPDLAWKGVALDVRFLRPVRLGDTITGGGRRLDDDGAFEVWVINDRDEPVIKGAAILPGVAPMALAAAG
jgi:3-hydroxybutyryl-CoA dehydratase